MPVATLAAGPHLPSVEGRHGYGVAKVWALDLAQDLDQCRQGHVAGSDLSTKLLLTCLPGTCQKSFAWALARR